MLLLFINIFKYLAGIALIKGRLFSVIYFFNLKIFKIVKKTLLSIFSLIGIVIIIPLSSIAQKGMLTSEEELIGETSEFSFGLHTGIFDCNQSYNYPFNIGVVAQYHYVPDISKKMFFGTEMGIFYTTGREDKLNRKTKLTIMDISVFPGLSFPINSKITSNDNSLTRMKKLSKARKISFALGLALAIPLQKKSEGHGVNINAIKPGLGLTLRTSYDMPNRLMVFLSATRIGRDLDGYAYQSSTSNVRSNGNKHNATYYYKFGILWNVFNK